MEKCNCKKLEQERDAAIAERDKMFVSWEASVFLEKETLNKHAQLEKDAQGLAVALDTALRQWRMYMTDFNQCDVESMDHHEAEVFRDTEKALKAWEGREK